MKFVIECSKRGTPTNSRSDLIRQLQNAYSGEKAAAYAYRGHALASSNLEERSAILKIEADEWAHRACIRAMLAELEAGPRFTRELLMTLVGIVIFCLCRLGGWFNVFNFGWYMSMYGAGKLEQGNIIEYEVAARSAIASDNKKFVEDLIHMAEIEWDHELYFRSKTITSRWTRWIQVWTPPPPREKTRQTLRLPSFDHEERQI